MTDKGIVQGGGGREPIPYDSPRDFREGPIVIESCSTGNNGCSGVATFWNQANQPASFTVWFRNGSAGRSNFILEAGQSHGIHVQYGDTYSSAWGRVVVPDNNTRYWIYVG